MSVRIRIGDRIRVLSVWYGYRFALEKNQIATVIDTFEYHGNTWLKVIGKDGASHNLLREEVAPLISNLLIKNRKNYARST